MTDIGTIYERARRRHQRIDEGNLAFGRKPLSALDLTWDARAHKIELWVRSAFLGDRPDVEKLETAMAHLAAVIHAVEQAETVDVTTGKDAA